jgi:hypothetical protein
MGKPESIESYGLVQCGDLEIYIAPDIWQEINEQTEKILIAIEGYGRFWLYLEQQ